MAKEINLSTDSTLIGSEKIRSISSEGKSVNIPISLLQSYIQKNQRFAIYDGASDTVPFDNQINNSIQYFDVRLEFSGPRTERDYFPSEYGDILLNTLSAPSGSVFDFRSLPLGTFLEFDVEFDVVQQSRGIRVNTDLGIEVKFTYPNGNIEKKTIITPPIYISTTASFYNRIKVSFSTYIKNTLTDSLLGGGIEIRSIDLPILGTVIDIENLIVRVKL